MVNGEQWTTRDAEGHVESGTADQSAKGSALTDLERHFDPDLIRQFFQALVLEARGSARTASRDCIRLHGILRSGERLWPHWLPKNADEYEFHADCERGVLLALIGRYKGREFWRSEVIDVRFDENVPDELFTYRAQPGEQFRAPVPVVERLTFASALKQMPFKMFLASRPSGLEQAPVEFMYHPSRTNSPRPHLCLFYHTEPRRFLAIYEGATEDLKRQEYEWEQLSVDGQELRISDPGPGRAYRLVALEKQGTYIDIAADMEREQIIELATSLTAATDRSST